MKRVEQHYKTCIMSKKFLLNILFLALACTATLLTGFRDVKVFSKTDLSEVSCGWPLQFIVQDQSRKDPPYPWTVRCGLPFSLEDPIRFFYWPQFIIDILAFYAFIIFLWYGMIKKRVENNSK